MQAKIDVNDLDISTLVLSAVLSAFNTSLQELVVFLLVSSFLTFLVDLRLMLSGGAFDVRAWFCLHIVAVYLDCSLIMSHLLVIRPVSVEVLSTQLPKS